MECSGGRLWIGPSAGVKMILLSGMQSAGLTMDECMDVRPGLHSGWSVGGLALQQEDWRWIGG